MINSNLLIYLYIQFAPKFISSRKCHSRDTFDTLKYRSKAHYNVRRNYSKYLYVASEIPWSFNQRRESRDGEYGTVGLVQSDVRTYECTYAYFMFIYICMWAATCSRRRSGLSNEVYRSAYRTDIFPFWLEFTIRCIFLAFHHLLIGFALRLDSAHCDSGTTKSNGKYLLAKYRNIF